MLDPGPIPVIRSDRGGKVTYHGPGQWVAYLLIDLARCGWNVRQLTLAMENAVIHLLAQHGVSAQARRDAPGYMYREPKLRPWGCAFTRAVATTD
ncbi:hypothetical protein [Acidithiobacillus sp. AMEEHan]|uniref:lipoyl protein ligase domain-containing protein n=1 Tax=Acidithiobacillus sp. AMEEHan TaxID=2994951 RepID=UPI0035ADA9DC